MSDQPDTVSRINRPVKFPGTPEQADRNYATHSWGEYGRCYRCDSKPWHVAADYPCGEDVPRETVEMPDDPKEAAAAMFQNLFGSAR